MDGVVRKNSTDSDSTVITSNCSAYAVPITKDEYNSFVGLTFDRVEALNGYRTLGFNSPELTCTANNSLFDNSLYRNYNQDYEYTVNWLSRSIEDASNKELAKKKQELEEKYTSYAGEYVWLIDGTKRIRTIAHILDRDDNGFYGLVMGTKQYDVYYIDYNDIESDATAIEWFEEERKLFGRAK